MKMRFTLRWGLYSFSLAGDQWDDLRSPYISCFLHRFWALKQWETLATRFILRKTAWGNVSFPCWGLSWFAWVEHGFSKIFQVPSKWYHFQSVSWNVTPQKKPQRLRKTTDRWLHLLSARHSSHLPSTSCFKTYPPVSSNMAGWKIPYEWRFLARNILDFHGPWLPARHVWHRRVNPIKSHETTIFPWVFLWLSYGSQCHLLPNRKAPWASKSRRLAAPHPANPSAACPPLGTRRVPWPLGSLGPWELTEFSQENQQETCDFMGYRWWYKKMGYDEQTWWIMVN